MTYLTVRKIDGRLMLEIPADLAARLRVEEGGVVSVDEAALSVIEDDPAAVERAVALGLREMDRFEATFRALAK